MFGKESVGLGAGESSIDHWDSWRVVAQDDDVAFGATVAELGVCSTEGSKGPEWIYRNGRRDALPADLDTLPPGLALAMVVLTTDRATVSAFDLVRLLKAEARLLSALNAGYYDTISEISRCFDSENGDSGAAEIGAALRLTRVAAETEYAFAASLQLHPAIRAALASGDIDVRRARAILESMRGLDPARVEGILDRILPVASQLTTGQIRARTVRLCTEADPASMTKRYMAGVEHRRMVLQANSDTTANLCGFDLPPDLAAAAAQRINWLARKARSKDDSRTLDQIRADVFLDLLTGRGQAGTAPAAVDIVVDLATLTGESEGPGHIPGFGPVVAEVARKVVARQSASGWEFTATDQGRPVATGTIARRPTVAMKRRIRARHDTCAWPGCRMPSRHSDIDHRIPWAKGGSTTLGNLVPLCDRHHGLLDKGWSYGSMPGGVLRFESPLGHHYHSGLDPP